MSECSSSCGCGKLVYNVIFACSGSSDVGQIADRAARELSAKKIGVMSCVVGVAAREADLLEVAGGANKTLVLDGCDKECAKKVMISAGFPNFEYLRLDRIGMAKRSSPPTDRRIADAVEAGRKALGA